MRKQGKPRGTSSAPDFDEKKARQAAKESAAELVQATVANNAKTFGKLKEIGQDLSEGVAKKGKKIGLIVGGMVPFFGAAADAYGFQQDASDVGIDYATANLAADNTPGLEYLKGGLDIFSTIFTGEDFGHPKGLGATAENWTHTYFVKTREELKTLPEKIDTIRGLQENGVAPRIPPWWEKYLDVFDLP